MSLIELIDESVVRVPLASKDKDGIIRELINLLFEAGKVSDKAKVEKAVFTRESLGSTGLTDGIAVPHGKTDAVSDLAMAIGIAPEGVAFDSMDGAPSKLFFLIVAPPDKSGPHIEALSEIARLSRSKAFCRALANASDAAEVVSLLKGD